MLTVRMPETLKNDLEDWADNNGYPSKSYAIRELVREATQ